MRGRPILGVVAGFLFGLSTAFTLLLSGLLPTSSIWLVLLPILGVALGLLMAWWAPFGHIDHGPKPLTSDVSYASATGTADRAGDGSVEPAGAASVKVSAEIVDSAEGDRTDALEEQQNDPSGTGSDADSGD